MRTALTVRWQLLLLVLALAVPFTVFLLVSAERQSRHGREEAGQQMLAVARLTAARLDDHVGNILQILSVLSVSVGVELQDTDKNDAVLRALAANLPPQINNVSVWTAAGQNIGTLLPELRAPGVNVVQRKYFRDALRKVPLAIEAPVAALTNGQQVGLFALGIERGGRMVGVVAVSARLSHLQTLLAPKGTLPDSAVMTVSDESGVVLARSLDPEKWIGRNLLTQGTGGLASSLQRREGTRDGPSAEGVVRIAGFTMAHRVPWLVYVGIPAQEALAPVRVRLVENLAVGAAMLALGLLLAVWVAHSISAPLRQLGAVASALENGDLSRRSQIDKGGEIGALASTLNRMAEALQQRTAALVASEVRLRLLAESDHLTGLPNRGLFLDRLDAALADHAKSGAPMALLFLDIDRFKSVNDTLGHGAGDELLKSFARQLQSSVRNTDTVARLAGDEFTVILQALSGQDDARRVAQTLVEESRRSVGTGERTVNISTSIGIAMFSASDSATALLRRADEALYAAKRAGRDRYVFADVPQTAPADARRPASPQPSPARPAR